jgi:hypothetical protein
MSNRKADELSVGPVEEQARARVREANARAMGRGVIGGPRHGFTPEELAAIEAERRQAREAKRETGPNRVLSSQLHYLMKPRPLAV